jgi:hypothetical protein
MPSTPPVRVGGIHGGHAGRGCLRTECRTDWVRLVLETRRFLTQLARFCRVLAKNGDVGRLSGHEIPCRTHAVSEENGLRSGPLSGGCRRQVDSPSARRARHTRRPEAAVPERPRRHALPRAGNRANRICFRKCFLRGRRRPFGGSQQALFWFRLSSWSVWQDERYVGHEISWITES